MTVGNIYILLLQNIVKCIKTYFLQSLQGHLSVAQRFVFVLQIPSKFTLLIPLGTNSCIFWEREDMLSFPIYTVRLSHPSKADSFIRFYSFCTM